jgi:subtilisin-like proprotein convertase family protein
MAHRLLRLVLIFLCLLGALATPAWAQVLDPIKIRDLGQERNFLVSERELYVIHRTATGEGGLRHRIESGVSGAVVLEDSPTRALVRLPLPINLSAAAQRKDPVSVALPEVEVLPVLYAAGTLPETNTRRFATREVLVPVPQNQSVDDLAKTLKATAARPTIKTGYYILTFPTPYQAFDAVKTLRGGGLDGQPVLQHVMAKYDVEIPKDQFFSSQWHLVNTGQDNGVPGVDANVLGAWQVTKGAGITLAIVDDCLQTLHPDLTDGCPPLSSRLHHDFNDNDDDPRPGSTNDKHGTSCAGVAGARQNNGVPDPDTGALLGVSGAAPEVRLLGLRLIASGFTDEDSARALYWAPPNAVVDVSSNSWGPPDGYFGLAGPDILTKEALRKAAVEGRNGRGQVTCFAAGNGLGYGDDSNYDGFANSRYVLAVSACGHRGTQAVYSEPGANILVAAPSQGDFSSIAITTTDVTGISGYNPELHNPSAKLNLPNTDYTNTFNGTSSACPLVAGCVSLILGANPDLGWRDVKEIVAATATKIDSTDTGWYVDGFSALTNEAGFKFNHKYGGGMINASAAVARARTWTNLGPEVKQSHALLSGAGGAVPAPIPDASGGFVPLLRTFDFSNDPNLRVEQIEVVVDISHPHRSDLLITLISPTGTRSVLATPHFVYSTLDTDVDFKDYAIDFATYHNPEGTQGWTFTTTHDWGENSNGTNNINGKGKWTLEIYDVFSGSTGTLNAATLNLYGTLGANNTPAPEQRFVIEKALYEPVESAGTITVNVQRLGSTVGDAYVDFTTVPGTATPFDGSAPANPYDYKPASGTLHFSPGQQFADTSITVEIADDALPERTENFFIALQNPVNGTLGGNAQATVNIYDDEQNQVTVVATDPDAKETDEDLAPDTGTFTISRQTALPNAVTVKFSLSGTAKMGSTPDSDYNSVPLSVTIPSLATSATVTVVPRNDQVMEGDETVVLKITPDVGYVVGLADTATVTIHDNDLPQVKLTVLGSNVAKESVVNHQTATCRIQRVTSNGQPLVDDKPLTIFLGFRGTQIPPSGQPFNNYTITANGNAVINAVDIPAGSDHVDLIIDPINDNIYQPTKTAVIDILPAASYTFQFAFLASAEIRIIEDDPVPEAVAPTVTIVEPKLKKLITPAAIVASGVAKDNNVVSKVLYRMNGGAWTPTTFNSAQTGPWSADVTAFRVRGANRLEVQAFDSVGNQSAIATTTFDYQEFQPLTVAVTGSGTVTSGFPGTTQRQVGLTYSIAAKPGNGSVFNGWTGNLSTSNNPNISFVMPANPATLTANFIPSPYTADIAGNYSGLLKGVVFDQANNVFRDSFNSATSGYLKLLVTPTGAFTGQIILGGVTYPLTGTFSGGGDFEGTIPRKNDLTLNVSLKINLDPSASATREVTGKVAYGSFRADVVADRASYDKSHPAPVGLVKNYTLLLPPLAPSGSSPRGNGVGTMSIDALGVVKWQGTLPDGTKVNTQTQALTKNSSLFSLVDFTNLATFIPKLTGGADPVSQFLWSQFTAPEQAVLTNVGSTALEQRTTLTTALNRIAQGVSIYESNRFAGVVLSGATLKIKDTNPAGPTLVRLNRLLLQDAYPTELAMHPTWPLFLLLYKNFGVMLGDNELDTTLPDSDVHGTVNWLKPVSSTDLYFPLGFKIEGSPFVGGIFTPKATGVRALDNFTGPSPNGKITLEQGSLIAAISRTLDLGTDNKVKLIDASPEKLVVTVDGKTGLLGGTFVHPVSNKATPITGILFQKREKAFGFFPGTSIQGVNPQTGRVTLEHVP